MLTGRTGVVAVRVDIQLLGGFEVRVEGRPVPAQVWARRHAALLVGLLALAPGRTLHREQVVDALWPDLSLRDAAPRLHKAAHYARTALGPRDAVVLGARSVRLLPDHDVRVDALEFQRLGSAAVADGGVAEAKAALARYGGELLPLDVYESWTHPHREPLGRLHRRLLRQAGDWHRLAALEPTDEEAHLALVRWHLARGERTVALRQLERLESALRRDLGLGLGEPALRVRAQVTAAAADDLLRLGQALSCAGLAGPDAQDAHAHDAHAHDADAHDRVPVDACCR